MQQIDFRLLSMGVSHFSDLVRQPLIVGVKQGNPLASGRFDGGIASCTDATIVLLDQAHSGIRCLDELCGIIVGTIINHDDLVYRAALREHGVKRAFDNVAAIVTGNDRGDSHDSDGQSGVVWQWYRAWKVGYRGAITVENAVLA